MAITELASVGQRYRVVLGAAANELWLVGAHDDPSVRGLRRSLADLIALDDQDLVVDLTEAASIAPLVIEELVGAGTYLSERGRRLVVRATSPLLRHALLRGGAGHLLGPRALA